MRIIHCADIHLDAALTRLDKAKASKMRADMLENFISLGSYARENNVDAVVIAGDLFDSENVEKSTLDVVKKMFEKYSDIDFFYLKGNHDSGEISDFDFRKEVGEYPENVKLFNNQWKSYSLNKNPDIVITGIEQSKKTTGDIYEDLILDEEKFNIVVLHGQAQMVKNVPEGNPEEIIPISALKYRGINYLALGHIHSFLNEILDDRGIYCYSGTLAGHGFDECGEKGFILLDINDKNFQCNCEFIPFAKRRFFWERLELSPEWDTPEVLNKLEKRLEDIDAKPEDFLRIEFLGEKNLYEDINTDYILSALQDKLYYIEIQDNSTARINYEEYLHKESLVGEFVRQVYKSDLDDRTKNEVIRRGIEALWS